ncbi:DUF748 domain-containing protein [Marinomonas algicola]|uniref:DUF748 domain-containing protein n=1 Tax=Marinomonas algicola TaxID=2773454 RepID=UPI00174A7882|nr:DUF748 domain-containing protein [Marinomonas algicola]
MNKSPLILFSLRRLALIFLSVIFIIGFLIWLLLPVVTKTILNHYFQQQNAQLIINELDINPFQGVIVAKDVEAYSLKSDAKEQVLSLESFKIDLSYSSLFNKTLYVNTLRLNGLNADLVQSENAWHVAGLTFPIPAATNDDVETMAPAEGEDVSPSDWRIDVPKIQISNTQLTLDRFNQDVPSAPFKDTLNINTILLSDIEGKANVWNAKADIDISINQSIVRLQSSFTYNPEKVTAFIELDELTVDSTQFSHYFIQNETPPQVLLSVSGDMEIEQGLADSNKRLSVSSQAFSVLLNDLTVSTPDLSFSSDSIQLNTQELAFNLSPDNHFDIQTAATLEANTSQFSMPTKDADQAKSGNTSTTGTHVSLGKLSTQASLNVSQDEALLTVLDSMTDIELLALKGHVNEFNIANEMSHLVLSELSIKQDKLNALDLDAHLRFDSKQLDLSSSIDPLKANYKNLQFGSEITLSKNAEKLDLRSLNTTLLTHTVEFIQDSVEFTNELTELSLPKLSLNRLLNGNHDLALELNPTLRSQNTNMKNAEDYAQYKDINFSGDLALKQADKQVAFDGQNIALSAKNVSANQADYKLDSSLIQLSLPNIAFHQNQNQEMSLKADPQVDLKQITVLNADDDQLLALGALSSSAVYVEKNPTTMSLKMDDITLSDTVISKPNTTQAETPYLAKFSKLYANALDITDTKASINAITLTDVESNLLFDNQRNLKNLVFSQNDDAASATKAAEETGKRTESSPTETSSVASSTTKALTDEPETQPYHLKLNEFKIDGESSIYINDEGIVPSLSQTLYIDNFSITKVDTSQPKQATHILLDARNGKYATIHLESEVTPSSDHLTMQTQLSTKEIELTPFSPYIADILGYTIESGQLDADIKVDSDNGKLAGNSALTFRRFDLGGRDDQTSSSPSVIPLNLAIGALKDGKNNIALNIPMSGDINNPSFQWQNFLIIPIRKALYSASSSYLMQTFVPYANIISVAQIASEQIFKLRMKPLDYLPEETGISDTQTQFVEQLSALLKEKREAQLKMCSIAVPADLGIEDTSVELTEIQIESLKALAQRRAENLKDSLIRSEDIASSRLFLCSSTIDRQAGASPRIEFEF